MSCFPNIHDICSKFCWIWDIDIKLQAHDSSSPWDCSRLIRNNILKIMVREFSLIPFQICGYAVVCKTFLYPYWLPTKVDLKQVGNSLSMLPNAGLKIEVNKNMIIFWFNIKNIKSISTPPFNVGFDNDPSAWIIIHTFIPRYSKRVRL